MLVTSDNRATIRVGLVLQPSIPHFQDATGPAAQARDLFALEIIDLCSADERLKSARILADGDRNSTDLIFIR